MSTFIDGAPPSVDPEPDDSRSDPEHGEKQEPGEGSLWLREEIARRIAAANSNSGGRHARRDNGGPIPSTGRTPRHSATPAPPVAGPALPVRPPRRDQILGEAQRPDRDGVDLRPDPWTGPRRADPDAAGGPGRPSPGSAGRPLPRRRPVPSPGPDQPGAPSRAGLGLPSRPAPPQGAAAARLLSPPDEPPQAVPPPAGIPSATPQPGAPQPGSQQAGVPEPAAAPLAESPAATPQPTEVPAAGTPAAAGAVAGAPAAETSTPPAPGAPVAWARPGAPGAPSIGGAPAARRAGAASPAVSLSGPSFAPAPDVSSPGTPSRGFRRGPSEATTHDALPSVIRRPDPGPPTGPVLDEPVLDELEDDDYDDAADDNAADDAADDAADGFGDDEPEDEILWSAAALPPPHDPVAVPQQRAAEPEEDSEPPRGARFPRLDDTEAEPSKRVRVVLAERKGVARPVRTVVDIQEGTAVGELLRTDLIVSQLRVALRFAVFAAVTLGALPLLFAWYPVIGETAVMGLRLPWLLLGVLVYPFLLLLGWWHTRSAERVEQNFADHVQE